MAEKRWAVKENAVPRSDEKALAGASPPGMPHGKRLLLALTAIVILAIVLVVVAIPKNAQPQETFDVSFKAIANGETILDETIKAEKGANAFEEMKYVANLEYQDYGAMGVMVESINGVRPRENEFWALYVDGEMAMTGINGITLEKDTLIEWKIEGIEDYSG